MTSPVAMTVIFIGGVVAIPVFGRWSHQVTEALVFLLATVLLVMAITYACDRWPDYFANPRAPISTNVAPLDN